MTPIIPLIIAAPLLVFYAWMLWDMANNDSLSNRPSPLLSWPPTSRFDWLVVLIFLNVFGAGLYYFTEYRKKH